MATRRIGKSLRVLWPASARRAAPDGGTAAITEHEGWARDRFDAWSTSATFQRLKPWLAYVQRQVLDRIDWARTTAVLDVACGSGYAVDEAARRLRDGGFACGCDLSEGMLRQRAGSYDSAKTGFAAASAQALPFQSGSFDAVICTTAFHHFPEPVEALREFKRVLRPGGQVLIADTCRDCSVGTWVWDLIHRLFEKGHVRYHRTDEMRAFLEEAGFGSVKVEVLSPSYAETRKLVRHTALISGILRAEAG